MNGYWQSEPKEVITIEVLTTTDRHGNTWHVPVIPRFTPKFIPLIPHYKRPRPLLNEDKTPKKARVVEKPW